MSIWRPASIDEEPSMSAFQWGIMRVKTAGGETSDHLKAAMPYGDGRVSSDIVSFDPEGRTIITNSGRRYKLIGGPGYNSNAEYVWNAWASINHVVSQEDVSEEYFAKITNLNK